MSEILEKMKKAHREGRLMPALKSRLMRYTQGIKYILHDPASDKVVLHSPDYVEPSKDKKEMEIVERIFESFREMKNDQKVDKNGFKYLSNRPFCCFLNFLIVH